MPDEGERLKAGLSEYVMRRDPIDHRMDPALPDDPTPVHAVEVFQMGSRGLREPEFLASYAYKTARCGSVIKVVMPMSFKSDDPDSCQACVAAVERGDPTPEGLRWYERNRADDDFAQPVPDELLPPLDEDGEDDR